MKYLENDFAVSAPVAKTKRILAFDLIRGFFLLVIMIDHIELYPNFFDFFTGKGRLWVSAAEGFFFMSGLLIGMIYKRRLAHGLMFIFRKLWTRAAELYVVGVGLTFLFLAWVEFTHHAPIKDNLPTPFPWHHFIGQALLMRFTYGWADFLVRFAILMFFAPVVFALVAKGKWWLALVGIFGFWWFRGLSFTLAWQLIFNLGIISGYYWQEIENHFKQLKTNTRRRIKIGFAAAAAITFTASYASVYVLSLLFHLWGADHLPAAWQHVAFTWGWINHDIWIYADKWTMGPLRVALFFIWFPVLYWLVRKYEVRLNKSTYGILELLGRNSLAVYTIHAFIVFVFKMYLVPAKTNVLQNFLITGGALALLILLTIIYKQLQPRLAFVMPWQSKLQRSGS
jgi:hypothetical protein